MPGVIPEIDIRTNLFDEAAKSIAGDNLPTWLTETIPNIVYLLKGNVEVEKNRLNKQQWRNRLEKTAESARHLLKELRDHNGFLPMLLNDIGERLLYESELHKGLKFLAARCEEKLAELPKTSKTRGGKKPVAKIDKTPAGTVLCALAVGLAWKEIHGRWPGIHNQRAQTACSALWEAAGGERRAWGNTPGGWRSDLEKARLFRGRYAEWVWQTLMHMK